MNRVVQKIQKSPIILIGPIRAGKSTVAQLLSERLNYPRFKMDILRHEYYKEIGYEEEKGNSIQQKDGFIGLFRYLKPFDLYAIKRVLKDCDFGVVDFGGGLSVYEDNALLEQVTDELKPYKYVILLLPSKDIQESINILNDRMKEKEYTEYFKEEGVKERMHLNKLFLEHPSNQRLAKYIFYTKDKSPEQTVTEIIEKLEGVNNNNF